MAKNISSKGAKALYAIVTIAVLVVVGISVYQRSVKPAKAPTNTDSQVKNDTAGSGQPPAADVAPKPATSTPQTGAASTTTSPVPKTTQGTYSSGEGDVSAPDIQVSEVDFDGSSFSPNPVNIKVNDYVLFKNKSSENFWPASNPHPTHTGYPGFDAQKTIPPGGRYTFQFTKAGSWGYHDHLDPSIGGTVVVSP